MTSSSSSSSDGATLVTTHDAIEPPAPPPELSTGMLVTVERDGHHPLDGSSFIAGLMLGMLALFIIQSAMKFYARRERIQGTGRDSVADEVAALRRRTATLETIVTDPAQRTAREIEALR